MADPSVQSQQRHIGRYVVEAKLGEGGMAETWLARLDGAKGFTKQVVVKTMRRECCTPEYHTMFADEARIGSRIEHANIPRILEFGQTEAGPFLVQEYVDGPSVIQILRREAAVGQFDLGLGCRIVADVAGALDSAYSTLDEQGRPLRVIHRDVSPSNILVSRRGTPKLIDFGVALFVDRETRTEAGVLKGKLRYMAPEVLLHGDVSHQGDLYSLGIVLYSLCVGETPWGSGGSTQTSFSDAAERAGGGIAPPSSRRPGIDPELDGIIQRCLHVDRAQRYASARELRDALWSWLQANGGPLTDADLADRLGVLFPEGPSDWRADDLTVATSMAREPQGPPPASARHWRWIMAATTVLLVFACVTLAGTTATLWWVVWPAVVVQAPASPAPVDDGQAILLLDAAEMAIAEGDLAEARVHLTAANGLVVDDADLRLRRAELDAEVSLRSRIVAIRELANIDAPTAGEQAQALALKYPDDPEVQELLAQLDPHLSPTASPTASPAAEPAPTAPAPAPSPKPPRPKPASARDDGLLGERSGRAPEPVPAPTVVAPDDVLKRR